MAAPEANNLEQQAREEILREAKRGAERASQVGAYGWTKPKLHPTNKRFLQNTVINSVQSNEKKNSPRKGDRKRGNDMRRGMHSAVLNSIHRNDSSHRRITYMDAVDIRKMRKANKESNPTDEKRLRKDSDDKEHSSSDKGQSK